MCKLSLKANSRKLTFNTCAYISLTEIQPYISTPLNRWEVQCLILMALYLAKNTILLRKKQGRYWEEEWISAFMGKAESSPSEPGGFGFRSEDHDGDICYYRGYVRKKGFAKKMSSTLVWIWGICRTLMGMSNMQVDLWIWNSERQWGLEIGVKGLRPYRWPLKPWRWVILLWG